MDYFRLTASSGPLWEQGPHFRSIKNYFWFWRQRDSKPGIWFQMRARYLCAKVTRLKMLSPKRLSFDHTEAQCFYHSMVVSAIPCRRMLACTRSAVATDGERHAGIIHSRKHPSAISYVWSDRFSDKFQSGSGGIRTQDPWIPSPTLYR